MSTILDKAIYYHREVRKLPIQNGSIFQGFPIFHYFKRVNGIETRYDNVEYWRPYDDANYYIYTNGDQFSFNDQYSFVNPKVNRPPKVKFTESFAVGTNYYFGNKLFICTSQRITFVCDYSPDVSIENPYAYPDVQIWVESDETYEPIYDEDGEIIYPAYWYHPYKKAFYTFPKPTSDIPCSSDSLLSKLFSGENRQEIDDQDIRYIINSIREARINNLVSTGKTREEATALILAEADKSFRGLTEVREEQRRRSSASILDRISEQRNQNRVPERRIFLSGNVVSRFNTRESAAINSSSTPVMEQVVPSGQTPLSHTFIHKPNQISYSNIGSEWSQIDRAANRALVNWRAYKLMQISFEFLVAPDEVGSLDDRRVIGYSGNTTESIDQQLRKLRNMAADPKPVVFRGFDAMFSSSLDSQVTNGSGVEFVIADFSITSVYRTANGQINRATCQITLQETASSLDESINFPKLQPVEKIDKSFTDRDKKVACRKLASGTLDPKSLTPRQRRIVENSCKKDPPKPAQVWSPPINLSSQ